MSSPAGIQVREARADDEAALCALEAAAWSPRSGFPSVIQSGTMPGSRFFTADNPPQIHLVAVAGDQVLGYIRLKPPTPLPENTHVMHVSGIAVDPAARRRGVAAALMGAAEPYSLAHGASKLSLRVLSTNQPAIALYEKLGFEREGVLRGEFRIDGADVDDVLMAKQLTPAR